jgi:hypothetical protein
MRSRYEHRTLDRRDAIVSIEVAEEREEVHDGALIEEGMI